MDVCEFRLSACFWFWHIKEWKGIFKVIEDLLVDAVRWYYIIYPEHDILSFLASRFMKFLLSKTSSELIAG